jgi:hypothetical protein
MRRAGLCPSANSIKVLMATVVSTMGKTNAVAALYSMARIKSRRTMKLTPNAPTPMSAVAPTAQ